MNKIDYYYAPISGYAYLGEPRLMEIAAKTSVDVHFKPVDIMRVFSAQDIVPPAKQSSARLQYRLLDLKRNAEYYRLPINPKPRHWPVPVELSARCVYAVSELGLDTHAVSFAILSAVYAQDRDVSDQQEIRQILGELNLDVEQVWDVLWSDTTARALEQSTQEAIDRGILGSPTYILNDDEMYFGQDRLYLLEHRLSQREQLQGV